MSYTWTNGEVITAEKLNQTGEGVFIVELTGQYPNYTASATGGEIKDALLAGKTVFALRDGLYEPLNAATQSFAMFGGFEIDEGALTVGQYVVGPDGTVEVARYPSEG